MIYYSFKKYQRLFWLSQTWEQEMEIKTVSLKLKDNLSVTLKFMYSWSIKNLCKSYINGWNTINCVTGTILTYNFLFLPSMSTMSSQVLLDRSSPMAYNYDSLFPNSIRNSSLSIYVLEGLSLTKDPKTFLTSNQST